MVSLQTFRQRLAAALPGLELRDNEPMYKHTTFRVGGPVTLMALPRSVEMTFLAAATSVLLKVRLFQAARLVVLTTSL